MADIELPALDLPDIPSGTGKRPAPGERQAQPSAGRRPAVPGADEKDAATCRIPDGSSGERDVNNLVTEMAEIMLRTANAEGDDFLVQVAHTMALVGESHSQGEYHGGSVCGECGLGDTSWPCWNWLQACYTGVEWLWQRAGLRRPVRP